MLYELNYGVQPRAFYKKYLRKPTITSLTYFALPIARLTTKPATISSLRRSIDKKKQSNAEKS